eukprot:TRINITY_DN1860_c1_g1_i1.p1 TRINITY_DN1860_c1_g1~~TRINITY_DN1860_c1_g1_i1.p1  ORF type:complete len:299 (+),score=81.08 TRINITY_DN1860_c1_g1_i1:27-899(+)
MRYSLISLTPTNTVSYQNAKIRDTNNPKLPTFHDSILQIDISSSVAEEFDQLANLELLVSLNIKDSKITKLPKCNLYHLESLDISKTTTFESFLGIEAPSLVLLRAQYCNINDVTLLNKFTKIQKLFVCKNDIESLLGLDLPELTVFDVSHNKLKSLEGLPRGLTHFFCVNTGIAIPQDVSIWSNISVLDLRYNFISNWEEIERLRGLKKLRRIFLTGNPLFKEEDEEEASPLTEQQRIKVLSYLPHLKAVDGEDFTEEDYEEAKEVAIERKRTLRDLKAQAEREIAGDD